MLNIIHLNWIMKARACVCGIHVSKIMEIMDSAPDISFMHWLPYQNQRGFQLLYHINYNSKYYSTFGIYIYWHNPSYYLLPISNLLS